MWEFLQGYRIWVALGVAVLATWLIHALPGHHPCIFRDVAEEKKHRQSDEDPRDQRPQVS